MTVEFSPNGANVTVLSLRFLPGKLKKSQNVLCFPVRYSIWILYACAVIRHARRRSKSALCMGGLGAAWPVINDIEALAILDKCFEANRIASVSNSLMA